MINMKQSRKGETLLDETKESDALEYPYGLRVGLDSESLDKLNMTELPAVGTTMTLTAKVEVVSVSQYESGGGEDRDVSLQITDMELRGEGTSGPRKLYDKSNMT